MKYYKKITAIIFLSIIAIGLITANLLVVVNYPLKYKKLIVEKSLQFDADKALIFSIIKAESSFDKDAVSNAGAIGLMQIMPATAVNAAMELGIDNFTTDMLYEPNINIEIGVFYYNYLKKKFGNVDCALAAYNAGEGNVNTWLNNIEYSSDGKTLQKIPFPETHNYLKKIKLNYRIYQNRLR